MKSKTCSVDSVGRLVIPKSVRASLGILGRAKPPRQNGRLVHAAPLPADWDSGDAIQQARDRRTIR